MKGKLIMTLTTLAYMLLSTQRAADLRPTHDAAELADHLINISTLPDTITDADTDDLHAIMTEMILNPID